MRTSGRVRQRGASADMFRLQISGSKILTRQFRRGQGQKKEGLRVYEEYLRETDYTCTSCSEARVSTSTLDTPFAIHSNHSQRTENPHVQYPSPVAGSGSRGGTQISGLCSIHGM